MWVDARFGDNWKENAKKNYPIDWIIDIAHQEGRRAILLEKENQELKKEIDRLKAIQ